MNLRGKYFSKTYTSLAGGDLVTDILSTLGLTDIVIKKLDLVAASDTDVKINGSPYCDLLAVGSKYELHIDSGDVMINSIIIKDASISIWVGIIY